MNNSSRFGWCSPSDSAVGGSSREIEVLRKLNNLVFNHEGVILHHTQSPCVPNVPNVPHCYGLSAFSAALGQRRGWCTE